MLSFYTGVYMGANGIETDVRKTRDGVLVLFHDKTPERVCGEGLIREISDYTWEELRELNVTKGSLSDKIVRFEDFLTHFAWRDLTFAIELKAAGIEEEVAELIRKYGMIKKTVVTSFQIDYIRNIKTYAPEIRIGLLTKEITDEIVAELVAMRADEYCPRATLVTRESVTRLHREGFRVRAWGISDEALMRNAVDCGCDGMTVNFPDKLVAYRQTKM
jgi:glycerophosphoryl diester phosphodiesterase